MKSLMVRGALALAAAMLVGCAPPPYESGAPADAAPAYTASTYDSRYGVVCYRYTGTSGGPSCVKVH